MTDDRTWDRIAAESELRPRSGPIADVPDVDIEAVVEPAEPSVLPTPIRVDEVPDAEPDVAPVMHKREGEPIGSVPYEPEAVDEDDDEPPLDTSPFEPTPAELLPPPELITEVPTAIEDDDSLVDIPEVTAAPEKAPWWKVMLGIGSSDSPAEPPAAEQV